jgi:tRNA(adenine34) deaminase
MWDTLSTPWQACLDEAWQAYCTGSLPIGAVIVGQDGEILTRGRNHIFQDGDLPFGAKNHEVMHAELQCTLALDQTNIPRRTAELYTSMEPCPMCLSTWYMSGMAVLHYAARDPYAGSTNLLESTWYMQKKGKKAYGPAILWLEDILIGLIVETEIRNRGFLPNSVKTRWESVLPAGVELGYKMASDSKLTKLREDSVSATEGFQYLIANYV